jgi:beta-lactamase class A
MRRPCPGPALLITTALALCAAGSTACSVPGATPAAASTRTTSPPAKPRPRPRPRTRPSTSSPSPRTSSAALRRHRGLCTSATHPGLAARISRAIASALHGRVSVTGVAADDPALGLSCRLHPWQEFHSASVVKVIILAGLLRELQARHQYLAPGQVTLARAMITKSDNDAATALWDDVGRPGLQRFLTAAQMTHTVLGPDDYWGVTEVDAHDEMVLLRLLVTPNKVLDRSSRAYALKLMAEVIPSQRWGVPAGAPADVTVHVKNGWLPDPTLWDINSIGDFTNRSGAYSIAILSRDNPTMNYGVDTIERIASPINQELDAYVRWAAKHSR